MHSTQDERRSWYVDRKISIEGILAILGTLSVMITMYHNLDTRTIGNEIAIAGLKETDTRLERKVDETRIEIGLKLDKNTEKIEQVIMRQERSGGAR